MSSQPPLPADAEGAVRENAPLKPWPEAPHRDVRLERVAHFPDQQVTGVAVSDAGRIFVALPRLTTEDVPISLGEVVDGKIVPYPGGTEWNDYRMTEGDADRQFVCAQAVVMDNRDVLWVLDSATPKGKGPVPGGPKLVKIDVARDRVVDVFHFDGAAVRNVLAALARPAGGRRLGSAAPSASGAAGRRRAPRLEPLLARQRQRGGQKGVTITSQIADRKFTKFNYGVLLVLTGMAILGITASVAWILTLRGPGGAL